ncbi:putative ankyrin repeat-containing domain, PGG domain, ankyrin repeat-containing domain superfamily [Helianthus annuus]|nr:putative ankyrin repeat-containing domain, PGG domain, ankyrin repeat-containing domain superfamily [Helianthus annuus]KAJ0787580.1 putative ankyrin repeat-containing domain, PGG domain, ankyrin repeat-containing domain superfamily [Helianthus annuus]
MDKILFEASLTGNVQVLNELLAQDELILDRVSLTRVSETPLHIAALRGHNDFAKILLLKKPTLATSLDSSRQTPLHLAAAAGHVEIARELLHVTSAEGCRFCDKDGRTPLYLAAKNEQLEIIKLLIETKPDLCKELQENGETILHTCIFYNRFEAFKLLCQLWNEDDELAMLKDRNGNTLLHLAAGHKQVQTVKYLLQKSSIRTNKNVVNKHGFTALDVLDHCPRDFDALGIRTLLLEANVQRSKHVKSFQTDESASSQNVMSNNKPNGNWLEKQRGILILATIVVATTSFYSGLHPPGGTFTDSKDGPLGNAVKTEPDVGPFSDFVIQNTIIMVLSLMIFVVLLSGIPLRNKFCLWVLNLATLCIMFFVAVTYLVEIANMSPDTWVNGLTMIMCYAWMLLCLLFAASHTISFITWVVNKLLKARTRTKMRNNNPINGV